MQRQKKKYIKCWVHTRVCLAIKYIKFLDMVKQLGISMSTIGFKTNLITGFRGLKNF